MAPELNESNFAPTIEKESAILVEFFGNLVSSLPTYAITC